MRLLLAVFLVIGLLAGCGGADESGAPSEAVIEKNLQRSTQKRLDTDPDAYGLRKGDTVLRVTCARTSGRAYECVGTLSSGVTFSSTVHVSQDGKKFVTEG